MRQRVHLITLGVEDLAAAARFYTAWGWTPVTDAPPGLVVFNLHGAALGLYPRDALEAEIGLPVTLGGGATVLSQNTRTQDEVDVMMAKAEAAGAEVVQPARTAFWGGYHGHVRDPDGHIWEIAYNPFSPLGADDTFQWGGAT